MCLIIAAPSGQPTPPDHLKNAYAAGNSDGWGVSYWTGNKVLVRKGFQIQQLLDVQRLIEGKPYVIHLRWATAGLRNVDNCHPFKIRKNFYMAHNGILPMQPPKGDVRSDTAMFAGMLKSFSTEDLLKNLESLGSMIGKSNKLTFQFEDEIHIVNEGQGLWTGGRWYSNDYYHLDPWATMWSDRFVCDEQSEWEKWLFEEEEKERKRCNWRGRKDYEPIHGKLISL